MRNIKLIIIPFTLFVFASGMTNAQELYNMTKIDKATNKYIDNNEITILSWREYESFIAKEYGAKSIEHRAVLPDSATFRNCYKHCYVISESNIKYKKGDVSFMLLESDNYPMVGITYEQCEAFCKWRTEHHVKNIEKPGIISFSMPSESDYEQARPFAQKTNDEPLAPIKNKRKIYGLFDNVKEFTTENRTLTDEPTGFRCIAIYNK